MGSLIVNRDTSKIFLFNNKFISGTFKNDTGAELDLVGGEVIGRDATDGKLVVLKSAGLNGTAIPLGVNRSCFEAIADAGEVKIFIAVSGDIAKGKVLLQGGDTLDTVVSDRTIGDRLIGDTAGIFLKETDELTELDNQ